MIKQFFRDSVIYGIGIIIPRGIAFLLLPLYTRVLSPSDYGIIDIVAIVTNLINLTVALEISQGVARFYCETDSQLEKTRYASTSLIFTVFMYTFFAYIALAFPNQMSNWILGSAEKIDIIKVAVFSIWINGIFYALQNQLRWSLKPKACALTSFICSIATISVTFLCIIHWEMGVIGVFWGITWGNLIGSIIALYYARHDIRAVFDWEKLFIMLKFSIPLVPSSVGVFFALYIDRIAIKELLTFTDLGIYGVSYRIGSVVGLLTAGFQSALTPLIYTYFREPDTPQNLARIFRYFMTGALIVLLSVSVFAYEILALLTTPEYYGAAQVIPILVPAILLSGMYIFAPGLGIGKKTKTIAIINIIAAGLNTSLNFILIPNLGICGSALATMLSALIVFSLYIYYGQKYYQIPYEWNKVVKGTFVVSFFVGLAQFINFQTLAILILCKAILLFIGIKGIFYLLITKGEVSKFLVSNYKKVLWLNHTR
jgi:O-antigen/teichoic acid export membrane protein